jgi:Zn finger protein HypA/HybF involved in hydrogenase expression
MKRNVNKEEFIKICNESTSMLQAAQKLSMHFNTFKRYAIKFNCYCTNQGGKGTSKPNGNKIPLDEILEGLHPTYQTYRLKLRMFKEGYLEDKCEKCGWHEKPFGAKYTPCELHHKDGDSSNHKKENLELICPNCHSLTINYRAKNRKD